MKRLSATSLVVMASCSMGDDQPPRPVIIPEQQALSYSEGGTVSVSCAGPTSSQVLTGSRATVRGLMITANSRPVIARRIRGLIEPSSQLGSAGTLTSARGTRYVSDLRIKNQVGQDLSDPAELTSQDGGTVAFEAHGNWQINSQETGTFSLEVGTSEVEESAREFTHHWYDVRLGTSQSGDGIELVYADNDAPVPADQVKYDPSCSPDTNAGFYIRPNYTDITVSLDTRLVSSSTVANPARNVPSLGMVFKNEGMQDGVVEGFDLIGTVMASDGQELALDSVIEQCKVNVGSLELLTVTPFEGRLSVRDAHLMLPGRNTERQVKVTCDLRWPSTESSETVQVRLSLVQGSIVLAPQDDPTYDLPRMSSDKSLEENAVPLTSRVSVTLHQ